MRIVVTLLMILVMGLLGTTSSSGQGQGSSPLSLTHYAYLPVVYGPLPSPPPTPTPISSPVVVSVGTAPSGVGINPTTNKVYVANKGGNTVSVIDGASNTVAATVSVGSFPWGVGG